MNVLCLLIFFVVVVTSFKITKPGILIERIASTIPEIIRQNIVNWNEAKKKNVETKQMNKNNKWMAAAAQLSSK